MILRDLRTPPRIASGWNANWVNYHDYGLLTGVGFALTLGVLCWQWSNAETDLIMSILPPSFHGFVPCFLFVKTERFSC